MRDILLGSWQVDNDDRPIELPKLLDAEILWNPFEDIVPRITKEEREAEAAAKRCSNLSSSLFIRSKE